MSRRTQAPVSPLLKPESRLAQCCACGEVFGGAEAFDRHLLPYAERENCRPPETVLHKNGRRILTQNEKGVWTRAFGC